MRARFLFCSALLLGMLAPATGIRGQESGEELAKVKERELETVREKISVLKKSMDRRAADRDRITGELQKAEVQISEKRVRLKEIETQKHFSEKKKASLEAKLKKRQAELDEETRQLGAQVQAAYSSGNQERIKLMLNQQDPATAGRMMVYYRYLSEYRGQNIAKVRRYLDELDELHGRAADEENRLAGLARARYVELVELNREQEKRQTLLAALNTRIEQEGNEVERLAAQEKDLARLIAELTSILSDYPITSEEPFSELKGRLTWPVAGRLVHDFGQPRASGRLKWNGVVLAAPRGREVRAVYHGRVIFADWLAGLGLLVIVDHGEGFMTLYGYNETILKSGGEWVAPGDVIATVGDSGGQQQASLYFEIRKGTRPINPRHWVTRRPKSG
ncbi:MAG: murein hydrolase activator EnvC family protein [Woeseia sp.]